MVKTYRLNPDAFQQKQKNILKRGIIISAVAIAAGLTITTLNTGFDWKVMLMMVLIMGGAVFVGIRKGLRLQKEAWESFELTLRPNSITKSQIRTDSIEILNKEIAEVSANDHGVTVRSKASSKLIFIPRELIGFDEVLSSLKSR